MAGGRRSQGTLVSSPEAAGVAAVATAAAHGLTGTDEAGSGGDD